jgi:hypothetical protein
MPQVSRCPRALMVLAPACFVAWLALPVSGQAPAAPTTSDAQARLEGFARHQAMATSSPFKDLTWQFLGPTNISGRVTDVAAVTPRGNSYVIYAASHGRGIWVMDAVPVQSFKK